MIDYSIEEVLTSLFKHSPSVQKGGEELAFFCPNCNHYKKKLTINITTGKFHCWVCNFRGNNLYGLLKHLKASSEYFDKLCKNWKPAKVVKKKTILQLPNEFVPVWQSSKSIIRKHTIAYCKKRGLNYNEMIRYNIGYCDSGEYVNRVIIPSYDTSANLNFFCGRDLFHSKMKYKLCNSTKNIIGLESTINFNHPITLVEGVFDAFSVKFNAIPLFGTVVSDALKIKILLNSPPRVNVLLDSDAIKHSLKICKFLIDYGISTHLVNVGEEDAADLGHEKVCDIIDSTHPLTEADLYNLNIKHNI